MSSLQRGWRATLLALALAAGCADADDSDERRGPLRQQTSGMDAGVPAEADASDTDAGSPASGMDAGPARAPSAIRGTATQAGCRSYAQPTGETCGSYYCAVTEAQIAAEVPVDSVCPEIANALCEGRIGRTIAQCTRARMRGGAGAGMEDEALRAEIHACALEDDEIAEQLSPICLGCFLSEAMCAATHCRMECQGDGSACDECRLRNNCEEPLYICAKLPNPF